MKEKPLNVRKHEIRVLLKMFTFDLGCLYDRAGMVLIEELFDPESGVSAKWLDESLRKKAEGEGEFRIMQPERLSVLAVALGYDDYHHFRKTIEQVELRHRTWDQAGAFLRVVTSTDFDALADDSLNGWLPPWIGPIPWGEQMLNDVASNFEDVFRGAYNGVLVLDEATIKRVFPAKIQALLAWAASTLGSVQVCYLGDPKHLNKAQGDASVFYEPMQLHQLKVWALTAEDFKATSTHATAQSPKQAASGGITNIVHGNVEHQFVQTGGRISGEGLSIFGNVIVKRKEGKDASQG